MIVVSQGVYFIHTYCFSNASYNLCIMNVSAKHIIKIDGKVGLFKGLGPRLCAGTIGTVVHSKVVQVGLNKSSVL